MDHYLGIDIGGTKIAGGVVDSGGHVLRRLELPTPAHDGGLAVLAAAVDLARSLIGPERIAGVGIGAGGQIDSRAGVVVSATDLLPGWAGTKIKSGFEAALSLPAAVENDVNALAAGEARFGAAKGLSTVIFLALGTGVGGALLLNGQIHHGAHWVGGEFGHILLSFDPTARRGLDGSVGTLESYCSGPGLVENWREIAGDRDRILIGPEIAREAARDPAGSASQAVARTGEYLGFGLVTLANALDPDAIVIGGGVASLGEALLAPARRVLAERAMPGPASCPVVTASLGPDSAIIGAASLAMPAKPGEIPLHPYLEGGGGAERRG